GFPLPMVAWAGPGPSSCCWRQRSGCGAELGRRAPARVLRAGGRRSYKTEPWSTFTVRVPWREKIPAPTPEPASRQAPSVVIPAQLQHHLVARRIQLAELAPGAQAQAQIAVQLQLLGQADMAADLAVVKVVGAGFEQQVASAIAPQESRVKAGGRAQGGGKIRMMLDPQGGQAVGQQLVVQPPAEASSTIEMPHQTLPAVLAGYPLEPGFHLP